MSEFVETNDGRLINVAHIVTAEWRDGEWCLKLSDGRHAYYRGDNFKAMNLNEALGKWKGPAQEDYECAPSPPSPV